MTLTQALLAGAIGTAFSTAVLAQATLDTNIQRDINQQQRIENGLKDGSLSTREAARLERGEARIDRMESNALRDGTMTQQEAARINRAQNAQSQAIYNQRHDAQTGNPNSPSSQRMQADVQRNINQETRIQQGVQNGTLTNREVGRLERGQARVERQQFRAGRDGHVGNVEQARIQGRQDVQSARIYNNKQNDRNR
jgi:hypothetical protein